MSNISKDWYPTIKLKLYGESKNTHETKEIVLDAHFDTGAVDLFISDEIVEQLGITGYFDQPHEGIVSGQSFEFYVKKIKISLMGSTSESLPQAIPCFIIKNFRHSPFGKTHPEMQALAGRTIPQHFNAIIEVDAPKCETRVLLQDWKGFEKEVANLYRKLGLRVHRNVNLSGNQIDVLLEENTPSGKTLRTIVECKYYQKAVGIQEVRELISVFDFSKSVGEAEHAVLVSSAGFTKDAYLVARAAGIELLEIEDLHARAHSLKKSGKKPAKVAHVEVETEKEKPLRKHSKTAFVIMPFKDEYRDIYMLGIRETFARHGYVCLRGDELQFTGRIMDKILDSIKGSDFILAEVTEHNPNVYYELGIAHAYEKPVILCTKDVTRAPFDISDLIHIAYRDIVDLREKLSHRLESLIIIEENG